jgi:hypothetical protein
MLENVLDNVSSRALTAIILLAIALVGIFSRIKENRALNALGKRAPRLGKWFYFSKRHLVVVFSIRSQY